LYLGGRKWQEAREHCIMRSFITRYVSPNIISVIKLRMMIWQGYVARMAEMRNAHSILVGKPKGKRPLGRHWSRWEDNIKMDLKEIGWEVVDCIYLAQDRDQWRAVVNKVMNLRVP
jgi:hypothetical protein